MPRSAWARSAHRTVAANDAANDAANGAADDSNAPAPSYQLNFPVSICQYITQSALNDSQGWSNVAGRFFS